MKIANVLALASARARSGETKIQHRTPIWQYTNIVMGILFSVIAFLGVYFGAQNLGFDDFMLKPLLSQLLFFTPSAITFSCVVFALLYEFNQSAFNISLDAINWLPISAGDYVLGSCICTLYFSLPVIGTIYGAMLGLAFLIGSFEGWILTLILGLLGGLIGGFATEILRAALNRASASMFKKSGQASIYGRLLIYIIFLTVFMSVFNIEVVFQVAQWFNMVAGGAWFFPLFWPSLAVLSLLSNNFTMTLTYSSLTLLLTWVFFVVGSSIRERNWVPEPVVMSVAPVGSIKPLASSRSFLGFTGAEAAIIRKDLRSLVRRRELMIYLSLPFIMVFVTLLSNGFEDLFNKAAPMADRLSFFQSPGISLLYLTFFLSIVSVGQEGGAAVNLLSAPIDIGKIARAKLVSTLILPLIGFGLTLLAIVLILQVSVALLALVAVFGLSCISGTAEAGLIIGSRFVDYTEVPRARFFRPEGVFIGIIGVVGVILANLSPLWLADQWGLSALTIPTEVVMVSAVAVIINLALLKLIPSQVAYALERAPL